MSATEGAVSGTTKRPRHYAMEYLMAENKQSVIDSFPEEWKDLIRAHLQILRDKNGAKKNSKKRK